MTDHETREQAIRLPFPWHKTLAGSDEHGNYYRWKPGIRWCDHGYGDQEAVADGVGAMLLVEVGRYTPPGFGKRVFYTRQFVLPSGEAVGKPRLKVMGVAGFTRLCRGYRYEFEVTDALKDVRMDTDVDIPTAEDYADAASY
jgi:hypothetical protein